jgi:hypothetical protein
MSAINAELVAATETSGSLAVISNPPGAEIFIDGDFKGVSPVTITGLSPGTHRILLTLKEYSNATTNLTILPGQTQKHSAELKKISRPSAIDLFLAAAAIVMIAIIALVVMFRKNSNTK